MALKHTSRPHRKRTKPLIPQPFETISINRLPVWLTGRSPALESGKFYPELDVNLYRNQLSDEKHADLDERASTLRTRAVRNQVLEASEFNWEVDAWRDVFSLIRDDDTFRMLDKRPYEFIEKDGNNKMSVKRRIPDATMGLRTFSGSDIDHGYICEVDDCKINHDSMQPSESLWDDRIDRQLLDSGCGLIVDGVWGESNLIFPFAVYEAKKRASTWEKAEAQVYHAFKVYLAMLDDLARDPSDVTRYQCEESTQYQLFGFTSCGSSWRVYIACYSLEMCHAETIWEGDVKDFSRAYELICLVDQIHDFAANQHRKFVIEHLERWLVHCEEHDPPLYQTDDVLRYLADPIWLKIKEASTKARYAKSVNTRLQNKLKMRENTHGRHSKRPQKGKMTRVSSTIQIQKRRNSGHQSNTANGSKPKRPRGRPRKSAKTPVNPPSNTTTRKTRNRA
ncbi:hypothetical protein CC77DRAFT_1064383 [Alternaria alternata]|uniref:Uncharacterized protein n=1 Tax=Alternaria alternata TaxID=5599 RepID=A0A177DC73_ALTAL|nr:hypothetical protein CC77DRAFT_1064383 [Alternaria alternata]OAG17118.1 hypothetical protein CC77DRAFT_1064383 [Alternaria alternata]